MLRSAPGRESLTPAPGAEHEEPYESTLPSRVRKAVLHAQKYDSVENHSVALAALGADPDEVSPMPDGEKRS